MTITLNDGEVDLIIEIIGESLPEDADKATNPIEVNLLDRLIELRNLAAGKVVGNPFFEEEAIVAYNRGIDDRLIELRNLAKRSDNACPGRDVEPGAPHVYKDGECVFCKERRR